MKEKIIVVLGPTASGKSDLAVEIAHLVNGEVISADSRQVYKGLDIGTGKITKKEMCGVPHYLLDVASPKRKFTAAQFRTHATEAIKKIQKSGKIPIICGGTGFYIDTLINKNPLPSVKPNLKLRKKLESKSIEELLNRLKKTDTDSFARIEKKNKRRIIRAIEIGINLGSVPPLIKEYKYDILFIGIKPKNLETRIRLRLKRRIKSGLISEAKKLRKSGLSFKRMDSLGLEYKFLSQLLQGRVTRSEFEENLAIAIRQYAKRQNTWFKRNKEIHWFPTGKDKKITPLVRKFLN